MNVMSNIKLLVKALIVIAIVFLCMGVAGKFLGAYGLFIGLAISAVAIAVLIHRFEDKIVEKSESDAE